MHTHMPPQSAILNARVGHELTEVNMRFALSHGRDMAGVRMLIIGFLSVYAGVWL